ncbi:ABC transporter substrate-binding protein [Ruminococcus sp. 5_1_39BFAA]|uniref:ABC transporter substrate-binding protein n=1 Tax=Ruminococcus sp. 5_1_39BFAA TaxID=457412 RepID=UPI003565C29D
MKAKKVLAGALAATMTLGMCSAVYADGDDKQDLVLMISASDDTFAPDIEAAVQEKFGDKYNLIFKAWDTQGVTQAIKTAGVAGEQLDIVEYWPGSMRTLVDSELAMPLDEYVDDEWKANFTNLEALNQGTYDDVLYNLPYSTVYPVIAVNTDIADEIGVTLSEDGQWTWDEFVEFCTKAKEAGYFGTGIQSDLAPWLTRMAIMQVWDTDEELQAWNDGQVSFLDEKIVGAFDMVKDYIEADLVYPGADACLAQEADQIEAALSNGKIASAFVVNSQAIATLENCGIENYVIMDWPNMGSNPSMPLLGGSSGLFIPSFSKNTEGAVEVLKFLTSSECADIRANTGCVSTVKTANADIDTEVMNSLSRSSDKIVDHECHHNSSDLDTTINQMPANYIMYGVESLEEMEDFRLAFIEEQE